MLCDSCSASFCWWNQNTAFCTQHLRNLPCRHCLSRIRTKTIAIDAQWHTKCQTSATDAYCWDLQMSRIVCAESYLKKTQSRYALWCPELTAPFLPIPRQMKETFKREAVTLPFENALGRGFVINKRSSKTLMRFQRTVSAQQWQFLHDCLRVSDLFNSFPGLGLSACASHLQVWRGVAELFCDPASLNPQVFATQLPASQHSSGAAEFLASKIPKTEMWCTNLARHQKGSETLFTKAGNVKGVKGEMKFCCA